LYIKLKSKEIHAGECNMNSHCCGIIIIIIIVSFTANIDNKLHGGEINDKMIG